MAEKQMPTGEVGIRKEARAKGLGVSNLQNLSGEVKAVFTRDFYEDAAERLLGHVLNNPELLDELADYEIGTDILSKDVALALEAALRLWAAGITPSIPDVAAEMARVDGGKDYGPFLVEMHAKATLGLGPGFHECARRLVEGQKRKLLEKTYLEAVDKLRNRVPLEEVLRGVAEVERQADDGAGYLEEVLPGEDVEPISWLVPDFVPAGRLVGVLGRPENFKSLWCHWLLCEHNIPTLYVVGPEVDASRHDFLLRAKDMPTGSVRGFEPKNLVVSLFDRDFVGELTKSVQRGGFRALLLDTLLDFSAGRKLNEAGEMALAMRSLRRIIDATGCAIIVITHPRKSADKEGGEDMDDVLGSRAFGAKFDLAFSLVRSGATLRVKRLKSRLRLDAPPETYFTCIPAEQSPNGKLTFALSKEEPAGFDPSGRVKEAIALAKDCIEQAGGKVEVRYVYERLRQEGFGGKIQRKVKEQALKVFKEGGTWVCTLK
ncbi:MAG: helicase RepA family protein [candidate division KSB1 bacterium]|nr:helicase RepA family protein [candidate division KSB1 bacterium]